MDSERSPQFPVICGKNAENFRLKVKPQASSPWETSVMRGPTPPYSAVRISYLEIWLVADFNKSYGSQPRDFAKTKIFSRDRLRSPRSTLPT